MKSAIKIIVLGLLLFLGSLICLLKQQQSLSSKTAIWKSKVHIMQDQAITALKVEEVPSNYLLKKLSDTAIEDLYYKHVENIEMICSNKVRLGNVADGGWDLCDDIHYRPNPPCVVYSFGISYDFSFDNAISTRFGCMVHSFDPSMNPRKKYRTAKNVTFHSVGLGIANYMDNRGWNLKTLDTIKKELNHTQIDILKLDIEQDELNCLTALLESGSLQNIRQLLFEMHLISTEFPIPSRMTFWKALQILRGLHDQGFRIFYFLGNRFCVYQSIYTARSFIGCHEVFMVNTKRNQMMT